MICSIQKAMNILAILSNEKNNPVPLIEIVARTGYPKPTCSHILETLCHDGYVKRISHSKGYVLGPSLYHLTRYGRYEAEFVSLCRPIMRWMEKKVTQQWCFRSFRTIRNLLSITPTMSKIFFWSIPQYE